MTIFRLSPPKPAFPQVSTLPLCLIRLRMEEKDLQSCELKGTINSLCSRLSRIQVV